MVATDEIILESKLGGNSAHRRRGPSISSVASVIKESSSTSSESGIWNTLTHKEAAEVSGGPTSTSGHKFGNSGDLLPDTPIPRHRDLDSCLDADTRSADPISIGILASLPQRCALLTDEGLTLDPMTGLYYARDRNYDLTLANVLRQEPKSRYSRSKESGLRQEPKSSRRAGTGVAHREINQDPLSYPGTAALARPGGGTGFRLGTGSSDRLNINGANTYQFVESNPVGNVDPWGLSLDMAPPPVAPGVTRRMKVAAPEAPRPTPAAAGISRRVVKRLQRREMMGKIHLRMAGRSRHSGTPSACRGGRLTILRISARRTLGI